MEMIQRTDEGGAMITFSKEELAVLALALHAMNEQVPRYVVRDYGGSLNRELPPYFILDVDVTAKHLLPEMLQLLE